MARNKNQDLPHHVKERLRHQKLQQILENVANHVPKPAIFKKETKAKKLRRVVLYMKYLILKNEELNKTKSDPVKRTTKCQDTSVKTNITFPDIPLNRKPKSKRANIVFLTKLSDASTNKLEDTESLNHQKCYHNTESGQKLSSTKNCVNVIDQSKSRNILLSENGLESYYDKSIKSSANITDKYVPNGNLENLSDNDIGLWKEDYPERSKSGTERKVERNGAGLQQYIQEFSKDLEKIHRINSLDGSLFHSDKQERNFKGIYSCNRERSFNNSRKELSSDAEYFFNEIESPCSFSDSVTLKNYHSSCDVQANKHLVTEQQSFSQNSYDFSPRESGVFTTLDNFKMLHSFSKSESPKIHKKCIDDLKIHEHQHSKYEIFSQGSDDLSADFFSSGESSTITSLHNFEKPHVSRSAMRRNDHSDYFDVKEEKHKLSKHPSFSQSSDNISSDIVSSGESGMLISSNENVLCENRHIGLEDILHSCANASPDILIKPESVVDAKSFNYSLASSQRSCDTLTSPDLFSDMKEDVQHANLDFSVDNILSKSCIKNSPLFSPNSERYLDYNIQEPNYTLPFIPNNAYNNLVDNRFVNYFSMNNFSQNRPLHALPPFSQIGNYPTVNRGNLTRFCNIVPNNEIYPLSSYCSNNMPDFNRSMYVDEDMGNYLCVPLKQEEEESFLPSEELSYSLNNFVDSGYCFSQRNFNT